MTDHDQLISALREVLNDGGGSPLLIKRIPFICQDIVWMKRLLWAILSGVGGLFIMLVGALLLRAI